MKTGYLITARLKSERLKEKILLDLNGKAILDHVIERCKATKGIDRVVLCTSTNNQDSRLRDFAEKHNIDFFAGSEDDVLLRLKNAAIENKIDNFLSITADNPLVSVYLSELFLEWSQKNSLNFGRVFGLPVGLTPYFLNSAALDIAVKMKQNHDTEIWGPFVFREDFFKIGYYKVNGCVIPEKERLTCDYPDDYEFLQIVLRQIQSDRTPDIFDLMHYYENNESVFQLSRIHSQRSLSVSEKNKIRAAFDKAKETGYAYARKLGVTLQPGLLQKTITL